MEKYNLSKNIDKNRSNEIKASSQKRHYSLAYKRKVISKAALCKAPGEIAALLRREGIYHHLLFMIGAKPRLMEVFVQALSISVVQQSH